MREPYAAAATAASDRAGWQYPPLVLGRRFTRAGVALLVLLVAGLLTAARGHASAAAAADVVLPPGRAGRAGRAAPAPTPRPRSKALLAGPTAAERKQGIRSQLPAGVPLRSVAVDARGRDGRSRREVRHRHARRQPLGAARAARADREPRSRA